jgi:hypothetical protein
VGKKEEGQWERKVKVQQERRRRRVEGKRGGQWEIRRRREEGKKGGGTEKEGGSGKEGRGQL